MIIGQNDPVRFCFYVLFLLCLFVAGSAFAQTSTSGSIKGRVVNESGQPLPNVRVLVRAVGAPLTQEGATATTDREGKFEVSGLEPRSYQIGAWLTRTQSSIPAMIRGRSTTGLVISLRW
jgi:hypothetical protein